jgi:hypothetical protein
MDSLKRVLQGWEKDLEHLENGKGMIDDDHQEAFEAELDDLKEQLNDIQIRLRSMKEGNIKEWAVGHDELRAKMEAFKADMERTADRFDAEYQPNSSEWEGDYNEFIDVDPAIIYAGAYDKQIAS